MDKAADASAVSLALLGFPGRLWRTLKRLSMRGGPNGFPLYVIQRIIEENLCDTNSVKAHCWGTFLCGNNQPHAGTDCCFTCTPEGSSAPTDAQTAARSKFRRDSHLPSNHPALLCQGLQTPVLKCDLVPEIHVGHAVQVLHQFEITIHKC